MSKRLSDSCKWDDDFFVGLPYKYKLLWIYILDKCDHAGLFKVVKRNMDFHLENDYDLNEVIKAFGDKIKVINDSLWFIPGFISFQYGRLNPNNRVHVSVIELLKNKGLYKEYISSIDTDKDIDKEKDEEKAKALDTPARIDDNCPGLDFSFPVFKDKYPRDKQNVQPGITRAQKIWSESTNGHISEVFKALENYCKSDKVKDGFIMGADKFITDSWRDYLDFKKFGKDEQDGPIELL